MSTAHPIKIFILSLIEEGPINKKNAKLGAISNEIFNLF